MKCDESCVNNGELCQEMVWDDGSAKRVVGWLHRVYAVVFEHAVTGERTVATIDQHASVTIDEDRHEFPLADETET